MTKVLLAWIGLTDLKAPRDSSVGLGPIAQAVGARPFDRVALLCDRMDEGRAFLRWLGTHTTAKLELVPAKLRSPTDFGDIHENAVAACTRVIEENKGPLELTFHLSPGTPAMAAIWIILGKTRFPATLIQSSQQHGVQTASVPFDISADFIPDLLRGPDERLRRQSAEPPPATPEFADILHRSKVMARLVDRARRVAVRNVPVLLEGESGTGKELLARAIHRASPRRDACFLAVNCGAIPENLVEAHFFGHERGAFTDAKEAKAGLFESARGGTLFLDEVGELPGPVQVKLLRALQEGEVVRVGANKPTKVDVRIVAATNRALLQEVGAGRFREDLFYRLAVAVLLIPPLRDREGDLGMLIEKLLDKVNAEAASEPAYKKKQLSAGARNILLQHRWPGNVRELLNTLRRLSIWSDGVTVTAADAREALLEAPTRTGQDVLGRTMGEGFDLQDLLGQVARHYLSRALEESNGNKTRAAELVGLPSYQTLTNWLGKYEVQS